MTNESNPSAGAIRAAEKIFEETLGASGTKVSVLVLARIIDEETGMEELIQLFEELFEMMREWKGTMNIVDAVRTIEIRDKVQKAKGEPPAPLEKPKYPDDPPDRINMNSY